MIIDNVRKLVAEQLCIEEREITEDSAFIEDLGADSLDIVELIMVFESEFDMEIPEDDVEEIKTIGDAVAYIEEHRG